jgi:hypothetical protein
MFTSPCDDITFLVNYIMLRPSAAAVLFDPSKQTPSTDRFLQEQIGGAEVCKVILLLSRHRYIEARGKHDDSSRTSVVVVSLCTWSRPKATRGYYTLWHI